MHHLCEYINYTEVQPSGGAASKKCALQELQPSGGDAEEE